MGKKTISFILVALVLSLGLGVFAIHPNQEVCTTQLDCGFDVGRTDFKDIKRRGYPFVSRKTEVTRQYDKKTQEVIENTLSNNNFLGIALNTTFWAMCTVVLFKIIKLRKKKSAIFFGMAERVIIMFIDCHLFSQKYKNRMSYCSFGFLFNVKTWWVLQMFFRVP